MALPLRVSSSVFPADCQPMQISLIGLSCVGVKTFAACERYQPWFLPTEEDWQRRLEKRSANIAIVKALPEYIRAAGNPRRPATPDPTDRRIGKRRTRLSVPQHITIVIHFRYLSYFCRNSSLQQLCQSFAPRLSMLPTPRGFH